MLLALFACAAPPPPAPPPIPEPPPSTPVEMALVGRTSDHGLDSPSLPGGPARLGEGCATINAALAGDGPPCFIERWTGAVTIEVLRAGARLRFGDLPGRTSWSALSPSLLGCLGDPLALPPAGDPSATRRLLADRWVLAFSGDNLCHLGGTLTLSTTHDDADWSALTVEGLPWNQGGREAVMAGHRARLRALVRDHWRTLGTEERAEALRALAQDPDPEAARLVRQRSMKRVR